MRKDIPNEHIVVQSCHAAYEAGKHYTQVIHPSLIVLGVKDGKELKKAHKYVSNRLKKRTKKFTETDFKKSEQFTAFCTEPIADYEGFAEYSLLKFKKDVKPVQREGFLKSLFK